MKYRLRKSCTLGLSTFVAVALTSLSLSLYASSHSEHQILAQASGEHEERFVFRDDFTGTSLRPEWDLLNEDKDRWALFGGDYFLVVVTNDGERIKNELRFKKDLPEDFAIVLKFVSPDPHDEWFARLALVQDRENSLGLLFSGYLGKLQFVKRLRGEKSKFERTIEVGEADPCFFKIVKRGIEYSGYYSLDGRTWTKVGTHIFLRLAGKVQIGAWTDSNRETGIKFDFVDISEID
jgi:hypothetical protein